MPSPSGSGFFGQTFLATDLSGEEPHGVLETPLGPVLKIPRSTWHYLVRSLFGLDPALRQEVILEPFFLLGYYFGMGWSDYQVLPLKYRKWLIKRVDTEIAKAAKAQADIPTKSPPHNTPEIRAMLGKAKQAGSQNARIQRFT